MFAKWTLEFQARFQSLMALNRLCRQVLCSAGVYAIVLLNIDAK